MDESDKTELKQKPWLFQPGVSGNPKGRPKGSISMKEFARKMLMELPEEDKLEFLKGLPKDVVWKMSEGNPKQDVGVQGDMKLEINLTKYATDNPAQVQS